MASLELPSTSQEPTTPVDDDSFAAAIHHAVDLLESPIVRPDTSTFEFSQLPFGPFKDGLLAASMTLSDYVLSGRVAFRSGRSDRVGDLYLFKTPLTPGWHDEDGKPMMSNSDLRERLLAECPFEDKQLAHQVDSMSDSDMHAFLRDYLLPLRPASTIKNSYYHSHIARDPGMQTYSSTTTLVATTMPTIGKTIQLATALAPSLHNSIDPLHCEATVAHGRPVELHTYRHSSDANRVIELPIVDRYLTLGALSILLDRLVAEKYPF